MKYKNVLKKSKQNDYAHKKYVKGTGTGGGEYRQEPAITEKEQIVDDILGSRRYVSMRKGIPG